MGLYTKEQAKKIGEESGYTFSDADWKLLDTNPDAFVGVVGYKGDWDNAYKAGDEGGMNAANNGANGIRRHEGNYTGGADGSKYRPDYTYAPKANPYESKYNDRINAALDSILNREDFSYNPASDPSYQAYSEKYRNLGRSSMQNALGDAAALTGGQTSSYALAAAQQANDAYNARLSDQIPTLQQMAYDMYDRDLTQKRNDLSTLQGLDDSDYGRYRDSRADELAVYDRNYSADRDIIGDQRYDAEWKYQKEQDSLEWAYRNDEKSFNQAITKWQMNGTLDAGSAAYLQLPVGARYADYELQLQQLELDRGRLANDTRMTNSNIGVNNADIAYKNAQTANAGVDADYTRAQTDYTKSKTEAQKRENEMLYGGESGESGSQGYRTVRSAASAMNIGLRGQARDTQIRKMIENARDNGQISENEAELLMEEFRV